MVSKGEDMMDNYIKAKEQKILEIGKINKFSLRNEYWPNFHVELENVLFTKDMDWISKLNAEGNKAL